MAPLPLIIRLAARAPCRGVPVSSNYKGYPTVKQNLALIDRAAIDQGRLDFQVQAIALMLFGAEDRARCGLGRLQPVIVQHGGCGP